MNQQLLQAILEKVANGDTQLTDFELQALRQGLVDPQLADFAAAVVQMLSEQAPDVASRIGTAGLPGSTGPKMRDITTGAAPTPNRPQPNVAPELTGVGVSPAAEAPVTFDNTPPPTIPTNVDAIEGTPPNMLKDLPYAGQRMSEMNPYTSEGARRALDVYMRSAGFGGDSPLEGYLSEEAETAGMLARIVGGNLLTPMGMSENLQGFENVMGDLSAPGGGYIDPRKVTQLGLSQAFNAPDNLKNQYILYALGAALPYYDALSQQMIAQQMGQLSDDAFYEGMKDPNATMKDEIIRRGLFGVSRG